MGPGLYFLRSGVATVSSKIGAGRGSRRGERGLRGRAALQAPPQLLRVGGSGLSASPVVSPVARAQLGGSGPRRGRGRRRRRGRRLLLGGARVVTVLALPDRDRALHRAQAPRERVAVAGGVAGRGTGELRVSLKVSRRALGGDQGVEDVTSVLGVARGGGLDEKAAEDGRDTVVRLCALL